VKSQKEILETDLYGLTVRIHAFLQAKTLLAKYESDGEGLAGKDYTKANIRLRKVNQRLQKEVLPKNKIIKKLIKLHQQIERQGKWHDYIWGTIYEKGFNPQRQQTEKDYWRNFEKEFLQEEECLKKIKSLYKSINRIEETTFYTLDEALYEYQLVNSGRSGSGSMPQTGVNVAGQKHSKLVKEREQKQALHQAKTLKNLYSKDSGLV
jgi:hypothetical protein